MKVAQESPRGERWIISLLIAALSAVLWYLLLDTRSDMSTLRDSVIKNDLRLTTVETQLNNTIADVKSLMGKFDRFEIRSMPNRSN
jgi:hypothetical protein